jgi:UDP-N-acetylmuramoylalanine--D-glutamate ligase
MRFCDLENARIAILGMGREGSAVWRQIRKRYPRKRLSLFSESATGKEFEQKINPTIDEYHVGPFDVAKLKQYDVLVRSAGISLYRQDLQQLRSSGLKFTSASNLWFAENPDAKTICISGTMGKSTTAALTAHLLNRAGFKTCLAGNIGRPMLDCENKGIDWWVIELSSYQISDLEARPDIAVLLNLSEEHLDWHQGVEAYRADKLKLAQLAADGCLIANQSDDVLSDGLKNHRDVIWFNQAGNWQAGENSVFRQPCNQDRSRKSGHGLPTSGQNYVAAPASLPGTHNMHNLAAALTVVDVLGIGIPNPDEVLVSFTGLAHRLQLIGEKEGVRFVDDSISTTPVSVAAALQTVGVNGLVLLLGGFDRGLDWSCFANTLRTCTPHAIITLPDNGPKVFKCLSYAGVKPEGGLHAMASLKDAVALAQTLVPEQGCILLSPGAPSFPLFRSFEHRGAKFKEYSGL